MQEETDRQLHPIIGNYKLLHKLGEGGFGVVYMAEQQRPVRRKVALKIVKTDRLSDTSATVARFEAEGQALAMTEHPTLRRFSMAAPSQPEAVCWTKHSEMSNVHSSRWNW